MSATLAQIYALNPTTTIGNQDLMYIVQFPYTPGTDAGITGASLKALFVSSTAVINVAHGGTGNTTFTPYSIIAAGTTATGSFQNVVGVGTLGQVLTSQGASALPQWASPTTSGTVTSITAGTGITLTPSPITTTGSVALTVPVVVSSGGTGDTSFTAYSVVLGGTTSTGALQNVVGVGTLNQVLVSQGAAALPIWASVPGLVPAALTETNDTNVTMTLGGTPSTALLQSVSMTLGWTGQLSVARGGTGLATITANNLLVGTGTSPISLIAPSATSGIPLISQGASSNPAFGTAVVAGGGTGNTTFTAYSVIVGGTTATGAFQNVVGVGTTNQVLVSQGASALPIWASVPGLSPAALTETNDTNVTLTLGGTPSTALLQAVSLTLGWSGTLALTRGGLGASLTASNGGIFYSTATAGAILAGTSTALQMLQSGASSAPAWSTTTWPATSTINQLLYSSANNVISGLATVTSAVLTTVSGVPTWSTDLSVALGGTGNNTFTAYSVICAGTTATGAFQNVVGVGTSGQVLTSNGASALPTWQAAIGTGTVSSGTINQLAWYAASGTTVSGLTIADSSILVTSAGGVPSWSTTLPSFTTNTITFSPTTNGLKGTTAADNAAAGFVGEFMSSSVLVGSAVAVSNNTAKNITSITLSAGD